MPEGGHEVASSEEGRGKTEEGGGRKTDATEEGNQMPFFLIQLLVLLLIVGVGLYILGLIPMDATIKQIIKIVIILIVAIYLIYMLVGLGGWGSWGPHGSR